MNAPSTLSIIDRILLLAVKAEIILDRAWKATRVADRTDPNVMSTQERYSELAVLTKERDLLNLFAGMIRDSASVGVANEDIVATLGKHASLIVNNYEQVVGTGFHLNAPDEAAFKLATGVLIATEEGDSSLIVTRDF